MSKVAWKSDPEEHDYPAAQSYLSLVGSVSEVDDLVDRLRRSAVRTYKAKDMLRAAGLALLPQDNAHVASDLRKIESGKALSPVLLVRGDLVHGVPAQIADGYHRVCASYHVDENTDIPCRIVDLPHRS
ncbi:MAG TPA: hypothetical protein VG317_20165 [Pseudonocardiaceae bacterium]|nr:hypothetical protein [Pseudonocardiaceae bacterium]